MSDTVIKVDNLSKKYIISHKRQEPYMALRDVIAGGFSRMVQRGVVQPVKRLLSNSTIQQSASSTKEDFWALKDVSFEVKQGESVGIIGRNGSGKSTLLKILSRITEPTTGRVSIKGRVASLLEVGTGFHPELTGRENIFLNGAVLGMMKAEIKRKFDEIVAFAEVEKFLDTPVKRYSSGMYVRLAFAVAAHLEPEILIVDEVLAVGDAQFQKKCLGKMGEVAKEGRTVLFVSHNMVAVKSFCTRGIVLDNGQVETIGQIGEAIYHYSAISRKFGADMMKNIRGVKVLSVRINSGSDSSFMPSGPLFAEMDFYTEYRLPDCYLNFVIEDSEGRFLVHSRTDLYNLRPDFDAGMHRIRIEIPRLCLRAGIYTLWFRLYVNKGAVTEMADSERIMLEVDGPQVGGLVDVPCNWSWMKVNA